MFVNTTFPIARAAAHIQQLPSAGAGTTFPSVCTTGCHACSVGVGVGAPPPPRGARRVSSQRRAVVIALATALRSSSLATCRARCAEIFCMFSNIHAIHLRTFHLSTTDSLLTRLRSVYIRFRRPCAPLMYHASKIVTCRCSIPSTRQTHLTTVRFLVTRIDAASMINSTIPLSIAGKGILRSRPSF